MERSGKEALAHIRAALVMRGTSLSAWCRKRRLSRPWVYEAISGKRNGARAREVRKELLRLAGLDGRNTDDFPAKEGEG
jgi:hypothetical protein